MKNRTISHLSIVFCTLLLVLVFLNASAQVPAGMNYQAVVRDDDGELLPNRDVSLRLTITNSLMGAVLYRETHDVESNEFGLITLTIGTGIPVTGTFDEISWGSVAPWLQVEMDVNGGSAFVNMGSSRLLSVPYAFYSESSRFELANGSSAGNTLFWNGIAWVNNSNIYNNGGNVGINTSSPVGKLHIKGSENVAQLIVDGSVDQSNNNPLVKLRRNNGLDVLWLHSDDPSNAFIGVEAGLNNGGVDNTAIGAGALRDNTTGERNTAIGLHALYTNTIGKDITAIGVDAMVNSIQGDSNVAVGNFALPSNDVGSNNVAIGVSSLNKNTAGEENTASGNRALQRNITGNGNTAVGFDAMFNNTTGHFRTAIGYNSNSAGMSFNNNVAIGYNTICSASNQIRLGNSDVTSIGGFADWTNVSDVRFKQNISENVLGLDFIKALRPVTYTMNAEATDDWMADNYDIHNVSPDSESGNEIVYSGFIAQEVQATAEAMGYSFSGVDVPKNEKDYYGLRYGTFVVPLVKAVQEQQEQIEELKRENQELKSMHEQSMIDQQLQIHTLQSELEEIKAALKLR